MVSPRLALSSNELRSGIAWAAILLSCEGCFDLEKVDPGPGEAAAVCESLLINDFEDGSGLPNLQGWERWKVTSYKNNPADAFECAVGLVVPHSSSNELVFSFALHDVPDGRVDDVGAVVATHGPQSMDLSRFKRLLFSAALVKGQSAPPIGAQLAVELGCKQTPSEEPAEANERRVMQGARLDVKYSRFALELVNFGQPTWETNHLIGGAPECLRRIDSVGFSLYPTLQDGQQSAGTLVIDDISFDNGVENGCAP